METITQFYIVEIQQARNGEFAHIVHWAWDKDPDVARQKAESTYHSVLAAAAVSDTMSHAAILFSTDGFPVLNQCYKHVAPAEAPTEE